MISQSCRYVILFGLMLFIAGCQPRVSSSPESKAAAESKSSTQRDLWQFYDESLKGAKYIDLTHTITPSIPVWKGFSAAKFAAAVDPQTKQPYTYKKDGFEATRYELPTDQYGTQLDPPAHWAPEYPAIDELPVTYAVRPLVVISIVDQLAKDRRLPSAARRHSELGEPQWKGSAWLGGDGAVGLVEEMARSGAGRAKTFPGVSLDALKFLHEERRILFHGHEPLDTDATPNLEGEHWLLHHGYTQRKAWPTSIKCRKKVV